MFCCLHSSVRVYDIVHNYGNGDLIILDRSTLD